ncbi:MAG: hypothetical protein AAAB23_01630, partial [Pseudomonas sp.]
PDSGLIALPGADEQWMLTAWLQVQPGKLNLPLQFGGLPSDSDGAIDWFRREISCICSRSLIRV